MYDTRIVTCFICFRDGTTSRIRWASDLSTLTHICLLFFFFFSLLHIQSTTIHDNCFFFLSSVPTIFHSSLFSHGKISYWSSYKSLSRRFASFVVQVSDVSATPVSQTMLISSNSMTSSLRSPPQSLRCPQFQVRYIRWYSWNPKRELLCLFGDPRLHTILDWTQNFVSEENIFIKYFQILFFLLKTCNRSNSIVST